MHKRQLLSFIVAIFSLILGACTLDTFQNLPLGNVQAAPTQAPVLDEALYQRGITTYLNQYCGTCHQLPAANTRGNFGPQHNNVGATASERIQNEHYLGDATDAESYIRESIINPQVFIVPGYETTNHHMPSYGHLPPEDIDAIVYMLLQQRESD